MEKFEQKLTELLRYTVDYLPKLVLAIFVLLMGLSLINIVMKVVSRGMSAKEFEPTVQRFLTSLVDVILKIVLLLSVASMLGIETTSFLAILGSAGLAIGLALQGGLANFAGGVLLLIFKPFKVGDLIEAQGIYGEVQEISIFVTKMLTPHNKTVIIPNGPLANGIITNVSAKGNVRIDLNVNVAGDADLNKAKEVILAAIKSTPGVLAEPLPSVHISELGDGYTKLTFMPYAEPAAYWDVYFACYEYVRKAMIAEGIDSPIPHRVIIQK